jgi:hypothetical protein
MADSHMSSGGSSDGIRLNPISSHTKKETEVSFNF